MVFFIVLPFFVNFSVVLSVQHGFVGSGGAEFGAGFFAALGAKGLPAVGVVEDALAFGDGLAAGAGGVESGGEPVGIAGVFMHHAFQGVRASCSRSCRKNWRPLSWLAQGGRWCRDRVSDFGFRVSDGVGLIHLAGRLQATHWRAPALPSQFSQ